MEFSGKVERLDQNFTTGQFSITFTVNESAAVKNSFDSISKINKLSVKAVKYREKRSLDANSYFHVLVCKIAEAVNISKPHCKNILIAKYGQLEFIGDEMVVIKTNIPPEQMLEQETLHVLPCGVKVENDKEVNFYKVYRGSHTYNTKEMSVLIDGTVEDAQGLKIDTITPNEIQQIKERWGVKIEKAI